MKDNGISIIVPVFNASKFLRKCIESIVNQSYENIEIVLVNDGSTDDSLDICCDYAGRDDRIVVLDKENGGAASARNLGLDHASGDYIGFVDSDDYLDPTMYSKLIEAMLETEADIVECGHYRIEANYKNPAAVPLKAEILEGNYESSLRYVSQQNVQNYLWNKLYKRTLFENVRMPNLRYSEDYVTNIKLYYHCQRKTVISDCLYYYVNHENSIVNQRISSSHFDILKAGEMVLDFYKDKFRGSLKKYVYVSMLNKIRSLYVQMSDSGYDEKVATVLVNRYKEYFKIIKNELYDILGVSESRFKIFLTIVLFRINPKLYVLVYSIIRA